MTNAVKILEPQKNAWKRIAQGVGLTRIRAWRYTLRLSQLELSRSV